MKKEELVIKLNDLNLQYPPRIPKGILAAAAEDQLVIVYGLSDDIMRFAGAIDDDVSVYVGGFAYLNDKGLLESKCHEGDECPYFKRKKLTAKVIEALWTEGPLAWRYATGIPHSEFSIWEDGEEYCRGIVFSLDELEPNTAPEPNTAAPMYIPYCSHTAKEMVPIFKEIYLAAKGDQLEFILACQRSADPRVNKIGHFARDVLFELTGAIFRAKYSWL